MAKGERTQGLRIKITKGTYRKIVAAAFMNCRTPEQEASFMVERQLAGPMIYKAEMPTRYDALTSDTPIPAPGIILPQEEMPSMTEWETEDESRVNDACKSAGMTEAEITAAKLIYKTPDAVIASLKDKIAA